VKDIKELNTFIENVIRYSDANSSEILEYMVEHYTMADDLGISEEEVIEIIRKVSKELKQ
jgi:hypothetical protein